ncbi:alpha/beta fold hydrolase [Myxacorys almedinensis A]|uniref:Alpha/beta fold hydrolase n=2 Tax=Myxacorys TaxID=2056239 RepID=A0A8J8CHU6_9CYAN|nr:alpha/beta fold hydrolase [Myxacorys almedinensis A]
MQHSAIATQFYSWNGYRCAYDVPHEGQGVPLVLIHPIGVGLSRQFWQRFNQAWVQAGHRNTIYNPDLLGCGESDMPRVAYYPIDWATQLQCFLQTVVKRPCILIAQGALSPVAIDLVNLQPDLVRGLILSGPPAWTLVTKTTSDLQHRIAWNLFDSPLGSAFYRYARRSQFLQRFSIRQLFASDHQVDANWLEMLQAGASDLDSRHAVFSFLSGFWRQDYRHRVAQIEQPTLVVLGEKASSISREGKPESLDQRLEDYLEAFPQVQGVKIPGRNVLPYESTLAFVDAIAAWLESSPISKA